MSFYELKPRFQARLRPLVVRLHAMRVTANQVTLAACVGSVALGLWLFFAAPSLAAFGLIPAWMFLRMAFNAIDGMLACEHNQQSGLGAFLNELTDVVSDAAFCAGGAFQPVLGRHGDHAGRAECVRWRAGATVGASRRYDGPLGKSDRAFAFGALGLYVALGGPLAGWTRPGSS